MYDKFEILAMESTLCVALLGNADVTDVELVPVRPRSYGAETINELTELWAPRGLRFIGAIGLIDGKPRTVLAEPLDHIRIAALSQAFIVYCETLLSGHIEEQRMGDSLEFLTRLYALNDPRPHPRMDA